MFQSFGLGLATAGRVCIFKAVGVCFWDNRLSDKWAFHPMGCLLDYWEQWAVHSTTAVPEDPYQGKSRHIVRDPKSELLLL